MSIAPSIPSIKVRISTPHRLPLRPFTTIRSSNAEGPLRRPAAPSLSPPPTLSPSAPPLSPLSPPAPSQSPPKPIEAASASKEAVVTLEYQRKVAKELQDYFKQKKLEEANQGPFFGFLPKNEISNGRYCLLFPSN